MSAGSRERAAEVVRIYMEEIEFIDCSGADPKAPHISGLSSADYTKLENAIDALDAALAGEDSGASNHGDCQCQ